MARRREAGDEAPMEDSFTESWGNSSFDDPFAIGETDEFADLPVASPEPVSAARVTSARSSVTSGSGATLGGDASAHLSSSDLAAAMQAGSLAGLRASMAQGGLSAPFDAAGAGGGSAETAKYLRYERRGLWGQASYNIGYSYFGGLAVGGLVGLVGGVRRSPNTSPRVLLNSVLNGSGKLGSKTGNAAGVLALLYTVLERQLEDVEIDKLPGAVNRALGFDVFGRRSRWDGLIPGATAFATGALFTLPRAVTMRGLDAAHVSLPKRVAVVLTGGAAATLGVAALSLVGPTLFGDRSPFRFST